MPDAVLDDRHDHRQECKDEYQDRGTLDMHDDAYRAVLTPAAAHEDRAQSDEIRRALVDDVAALAAGEQLCLRFDERAFTVERIGESVLVILDWPCLGRALHELLDQVVAMNDPAMQLFLFRGETFLASVRRQFDVDDIDRLWAVIHA